jgi:nicotinamidase-related amidase/type 1 glutamine amidotransferase
MLREVTMAVAALCTVSSMAGPSDLVLTLRHRTPSEGSSPVERERVAWNAEKTAVIVCDMWDRHWCKGATSRVGELAPRIDAFVSAARASGALIIHAPSGAMDHYANHPGRKLARDAKGAGKLPDGIGAWCRQIDAEKDATWPIDQADGGCDCTPVCKQEEAWKRQIERIRIAEGDAVSDSGQEIWRLLAERGIEKVLLVGVHTNMCVMGRPFGLRNLVRCGKTVALVRDLTDTMYNSRSAPRVSHFRGTELVVEYIERHICPTVTSADLLGDTPFRFAGDTRPRVAMAIAEREYQTWETLPAFGHNVLGNPYGFSVDEVYGKPSQDRNLIPGFGPAVSRADLVLLSIRRRALPAADLGALKRHLAAGKPVIAVRTSSHAFDTKGKHPDGHAEWPEFDRDVIGGNYSGHYKAGPTATVTIAPGAEGHPILKDIPDSFPTKGSLYKTSPLSDKATPLLMGRIEGQEPEPVAWLHTYGKAKIFYTALGHPQDFAGDNPPTVRLLRNAALWLVDN